MEVMGQDGYITSDELSFHYVDYQGQGRDVLLLHGLASNARFWQLTAPYLAKKFRVLALDQRGHGTTAKPDSGYDFATVAADVASVIDRLELHKPILVGHSWGGNVGIQVAATYPELLSGLVCIDGGTIEPSAGEHSTWEDTKRALTPPDFASMRLDWEAFLDRARTRGRGEMWGDHMELFFRSNFEIQTDGTVLPRLRRDLHLQIVRALWEQRVSSLYPRIRCPVLILPARSDGEPSSTAGNTSTKEAQMNRALATLPNARLIWMEDSIHDVPVQRPSEVAGVIMDVENEGFFSVTAA
jgi:pimeloyl-ACP methyl ester carboxylesterase